MLSKTFKNRHLAGVFQIQSKPLNNVSPSFLPPTGPGSLAILLGRIRRSWAHSIPGRPRRCYFTAETHLLREAGTSAETAESLTGPPRTLRALAQAVGHDGNLICPGNRTPLSVFPQPAPLHGSVNQSQSPTMFQLRRNRNASPLPLQGNA